MGHRRVSADPELSADGDRSPWRQKPDAAIVADTLRHLEERQKIEQLRRDMTPEEAQRALQRRGRVVYRASVAGGRKDRWYVSGKGNNITDSQLVELAEKLLDLARGAS